VQGDKDVGAQREIKSSPKAARGPDPHAMTSVKIPVESDAGNCQMTAESVRRRLILRHTVEAGAISRCASKNSHLLPGVGSTANPGVAFFRHDRGDIVLFPDEFHDAGEVNLRSSPFKVRPQVQDCRLVFTSRKLHYHRRY